MYKTVLSGDKAQRTPPPPNGPSTSPLQFLPKKKKNPLPRAVIFYNNFDNIFLSSVLSYCENSEIINYIYEGCGTSDSWCCPLSISY